MDNSLSFWFRLLSADSTPLDRVICMAERDNCYHVETHLHGQFFSAAIDQGVRFTTIVPHQDAPAGYWDIVQVPEQVTPEIDDWAESIVGAKYDVFGALNSALGIPLHDPYRWFCSLIASAVGSRAGILGLDPLPSPSLLRQQLKAHVGIVSASATATFPVAGLRLGDDEMACITHLVQSRAIDPAMAEKVIAACGQGA